MTIPKIEMAWSDGAVRGARINSINDYSVDADPLRLVEIAQPQNKELACDYITGLGHCARAFAPFVASVDAYDPDEEILREAKRISDEAGITNIKYIAADFFDLGGKSGRYDILTARMALRHTGNPAGALKELNRVLKPSGRLILEDLLAPQHADLADFQNNLMRTRDRSHIKSNTLAEWETMLDQFDFDIDQVEIFPTEHNFENWARRLGADTDSVRMLAMFLKSSSPRIKRHFRLIEVDDKPVSFVTWIVIIRAHPRHASVGD